MFSQGHGQVVRAAPPRQSWYLVPPIQEKVEIIRLSKHYPERTMLNFRDRSLRIISTVLERLCTRLYHRAWNNMLLVISSYKRT